MQKKVCSRCQEELDLNRFYPSKNGKFGVYSICKKCVREKREEKNKAEYECIFKALKGIEWQKMF